MQNQEKFVVTTCSRDCPNSCGLLAHVVDGAIVSLKGNPDNPINQGRSCVKCPKFPDRVYHKERVLHPLKKENGVFVQTTWDDALDLIAQKINALREKDQCDRILYYQGFGERSALKLVNRRFFNLLGNTTITKGTTCGGTGQSSQDLDFGLRISHDVRDYQHSTSMILWGRNPVATGVNLLPYITDIKKRGGTVVLVDPLETETTPLCSWQIKPKPGTDAYLALACAQILFAQGKEDAAFLAEHCENLAQYREIVFSHSVAEYAAKCNVPEDKIYALTEVIASAGATAFVLGWGLHRWEYGHITLRCIDALGAVAGSIGVHGGGVSQGFEEYAPFDWSVWGDEMNPTRRKLFMPMIGQELEQADPPVEFAMVTAGNPVAMVADANRVKAAFEKIPFLVVVGHFLDDTAMLADLFLPTTTFLEEKDIVAAYGHDFIGPLNPAIPPRGECKSDFDIFMALGKRFSFADEYVKDLDTWLSIILKPTIEKGVDLNDIFAGGVNNPDAPALPYADKTFPTPSGKFILLDQFEVAPGHDHDCAFTLMSVAPKEWLCSELTLEAQQDQLLKVYLNPIVAREKGIAEGERCMVENDRGSLVCVAAFKEHQRKDLVVIYRGGWGLAGRNVNVLTKAMVSVVGNGAPYYETKVNLRRLAKDEV